MIDLDNFDQTSVIFDEKNGSLRIAGISMIVWGFMRKQKKTLTPIC